MFKHILVAYDGSAPAEKAFDVALGLASAFKGTVRVVSVVQPPEPAADVETEALIEAGRDHFETLLAQLAKRAAMADVPIETEILFGHPAELVLAVAEQRGVDHIVVGHKGKGLLRRWLVGSVSRVVVDHARISVTVVR
jgi:nucleotide-binding universal stress UspA family protein